jgi:hypothetical protein
MDRITGKEDEIMKAYQVVVKCQKCNGTGVNIREEIKIELSLPDNTPLDKREDMIPQVQAERKKEYVRSHKWENPKNSSYGMCKCYIQYEFLKGLLLADIPLKFEKIDYTEILPRDIMVNGSKRPLHDFIKLYIDKYSELSRNSVGLNFIGKVGTGRTFVSQFIGAQILKKRYSVHHIPFFDLVRIMNSYDQADLLKHIMDVDLLIIDELGNEHPNKRGFSGEIAHLLQRRIQIKKPIIFCINGVSTDDKLIDAYGGSFFSILDERNINLKFNTKAIPKTTRNKYIETILGDL